ncbi:hypothetical protein [Gluconobacter morbifer]|uniref:Uncharacterized protein n=1 Tax=Gluconobacter morbifer G707 TaxID=1088869 RepID=G6XIB5_9PROT|nr:hypothetical protein [Gluconobacter morbifer]EHH68555.1 hypothetical protein GMO_13250 [Gluconobacter morbifer G707]
MSPTRSRGLVWLLLICDGVQAILLVTLLVRSGAAAFSNFNFWASLFIVACTIPGLREQFRRPPPS